MDLEAWQRVFREYEEEQARRRDPLEPWFQAARDGDSATILEWLRGGADVDARGHNGSTALMIAAGNEDATVIRILLDHGARLDVQSMYGDSPMSCALDRALFRDDPPTGGATISLLREAGGRFGLREAVMLNDVELARQRLDEGADPDVGEDSYLGPLLMIAVRFGFLDVVRLLLDRGAKTEGTDDLGRTALILAADLGFAEIVSCLLDHGADINGPDWGGASPLALAVRLERTETFALLLIRGARRGLLDAVALDDVGLVASLLEAGADPNVEDYYGCGPLSGFAVCRGNVAIVRLLLDHGASLHPERYVGTLLEDAVREGHTEIARLLIDRGADLHDVGKEGRTPLAWAREEGRDEMIALLERAGATR